MNLAMVIALIKKYSDNNDVTNTEEVRFNILAANLIEVVDDETHNGLFKYDINHNLDSMNVIVQAYDDGELFDVADTVAIDENNVSVYLSEKKNCRLVMKSVLVLLLILPNVIESSLVKVRQIC